MPTLCEYIAALQALEREHGPLISVEKWMPSKGRHVAPTPVLAFARKHSSIRGKELPFFFHEDTDTLASKGQPIIRV